MTISMYCLYIHTDVNTLAQGIKSLLASQVWFQAIAGARTYDTDSHKITSQPFMYVCALVYFSVREIALSVL